MRKILFVLAFLISVPLIADDLENLLDGELDKEIIYESATFKSTRVVNCHSIERVRGGELDFRVAHRFGRLNSGFDDFFGFDDASTYISLETGITDWMMVGLGHATVRKFNNGFLKLSLLRQAKENAFIPVSVSAFTSIAHTSVEYPDSDPRDEFDSRLEYAFQLLIARKFTSDLSVQLSPTIVHRNIVMGENDNNLYSIGLSGRYKLSNWVSVNIEYFPVLNKDDMSGAEFFDPIAIGFDIETGGHVFQLYVTNGISIIESGYIGRTSGNLIDGDIHIGFNISRMFNLF